MRPPHTQIIIFHNEPPFHSCIYYNVIDDEYQKFKLITSSSNPDLSFIFTSELYHKAGNAKSPNSFLSGLFRYAQIDLILFGFPALGHTIRKPLPRLMPD